MKARNQFGKSVILLMAISIMVIVMMAPTRVVYASPGEDTANVGPSAVERGSIVPVVTETGQISLSADGLGTNGASGIIQVEKPAGATVRSAFMGAASTGFRYRQLVTGDVKIDGVGFPWDISTPSSIYSWNHWADVTSIVKSKIDAAAAGRVNFTITEVSTFGIDGEILAVIFDDPNQTTDNTVVLLFGAQAIGGDDFFVSLVDPLDLSDPDLVLDMSLGISYGYQTTSNVSQVSHVDVNGVRLTSSAGGQDDGAGENGALLTVGGLDDTNANPPPFASPSGVGPRIDDELYDLKPFVSDGDVLISVHSINPSYDDNIFFAGFFLTVMGTVEPTCPDMPPLECTEQEPCDVLETDDICPVDANTTSESYGLEPDVSTFCAGDITTVFHTKQGQYIDTEESTVEVCGTDCHNNCYERCVSIPIQECYRKCVRRCSNGVCLEWQTICDVVRYETECNNYCYQECSLHFDEETQTSYYNRACGFDLEDVVDVRVSNGACGGAIVDSYTMSGAGTATINIPVPLQPGSYDICVDSRLVKTITVENCGPACRIKIPQSSFVLNQAIRTGVLPVEIATSDGGGNYILNLERWEDAEKTLPMSVPSFLNIPSSVSVGDNSSTVFNIEAINPQPENGQIHWANVIIKAQGPVSCSCEATFDVDVILVAEIEVPVDIKPQSCPNPFNMTSKGVLPVAILGTEDFDATTVDPATVLLEGVAPLRDSLEDVSTPVEPSEDTCDCTTDSADGYMDMTLKFDHQAIAAALGTVQDGEMRVLTLTGMTYDSIPIMGQDCVVIIHKVTSKLSAETPNEFTLSNNYPNPFNPTTSISFNLPNPASWTLKIYNVAGQLVRTFEGHSSGQVSVIWNGKDNSGNEVASGIYFYRLTAGNFTATKKMVLTK